MAAFFLFSDPVRNLYLFYFASQTLHSIPLGGPPNVLDTDF